MSEYLKTKLHEQATSVDFRPPDLRTIRSTGDRRIRVRRVVSALAGAVAILLVSGTVVMLAGRVDRDQVVAPWPANAVSWAVGSTIHVGDRTVDVGHTVRAYVRTSAGFAVIDDEDNVYSVTTGGVKRIGHITAPPNQNSDAGDDQPRLVADPQGTLVGWIGEDTPGSLTFDTYDQATGQRFSRTAPPEARSAEDVVFHAIDGRTGYWRTPSGTYAVDLDTGADRQLLAGTQASGFELYQVENGTLSFRRNDSVLAGRSISEAREILRYGEERLTMVLLPSRLSPTGAWLSLAVVQLEKVAQGQFRGTKETAEVFHTSTGERITFDIAFNAPGNSAVAIPVVWLDDVTLQVATIVTDKPWGTPPTTVNAAIHTCTVPDGACRLAADLGRIPTTPAGAPIMPDGRSEFF